MLNYALTASSRCKKEAGLATDMRILGRLATQAEARLKFRSSAGHPFIACRVICSTATRKFFSKQGMLGFKHAGSQHDLTYSEGKTKEMDDIILQLLDVSKSFLDCAVFAHQGEEQLFFANLTHNFFDVFGLKHFGEIVEAFEQLQNEYQVEAGRMRRSLFQSKKLYQHDIELKRSSLAVLESISEQYLKEEACPQQNRAGSETKPLRRSKGKRSSESTEAEGEGGKERKLEERRQEMDLAASIAFHEYNRPLEMQFLHLKMQASFKHLAFQDLQSIIQALYASLTQLLA